MGLFGKMFEKKICSVCGGEIGLLGNRKLDDGNLCKNCSAKLSPWFTGRRRSTVEDIKAQLKYREENRKAVDEFNATLTLGRDTKVIFDEDNRKFMVTDASNYREANPDVLDYSQVTGVDLDIDEDHVEAMKEDKDGNDVSYDPPRYTFSYSFKMIIRVNHPYFDTISFDLSSSDIEINPDNPLPLNKKPDPKECHEYREYKKIGKEIKETLTSVRETVREEKAAAYAPKVAVVCPYCGATTMPDNDGCCEYCGGSIK